ncbi:hypothetical protein ACLB2K_040494 [Fragaria x ananassa]
MKSIDSTCALCGSGVQDLNHLFSSCMTAFVVWSFVNHLPNPSSFSNFEEWLVSTFQNGQPLTIEDSLLVCLQIWKVSNNVIFWYAQVTPAIVHAAAVTGSAYRLINKKISSSSLRNLETINKWIPYAPNLYKLNFDSSVTSNLSVASFIIKDFAGFPIVSSAQKLQHSYVLQAECIALKEWLLTAKKRNGNQIEIE